VQWSGPSPAQDPSNWQAIDYKHDVYGRRSEKKVDGFSTRYLYDGDQVIAEYDGNNNLLRKYIYGQCIDEPICMIEVADSNAFYYYHFDALGSVVALSDSSGDTVQTYEYSVYGQVAAEYEDFPNPYMFAGRRFDIEIGLYYNRARYYNPFTGRFLQADPVGYEAGMNLYAYCGNSPVGHADPSGLYYTFLDLDHEKTVKNARNQPLLTFAWVDDDDSEDVEVVWSGGNIDEWCNWAQRNPYFDNRSEADLPNIEDRVGWDLAQRLENPTQPGTKYTKEGLFWRLQALRYLGLEGSILLTLEDSDVTIRLYDTAEYIDYSSGAGVVHWNPNMDGIYDGSRKWHKVPPLALLWHELTHAADDVWGGISSRRSTEMFAMAAENRARYAFFTKVPRHTDIFPRPGYSQDEPDIASDAAVAWWIHIYRNFWRVRY